MEARKCNPTTCPKDGKSKHFDKFNKSAHPVLRPLICKRGDWSHLSVLLWAVFLVSELLLSFWDLIYRVKFPDKVNTCILSEVFLWFQWCHLLFSWQDLVISSPSMFLLSGISEKCHVLVLVRKQDSSLFMWLFLLILQVSYHSFILICALKWQPCWTPPVCQALL